MTSLQKVTHSQVCTDTLTDQLESSASPRAKPKSSSKSYSGCLAQRDKTPVFGDLSLSLIYVTNFTATSPAAHHRILTIPLTS